MPCYQVNTVSLDFQAGDLALLQMAATVGCWYTSNDGETRPVVDLGVEAANGQIFKARFLSDTMADRTVFDCQVLQDTLLPPQPLPQGLSYQGIGGVANTVVLSTVLHLPCDDGGVAKVRGQFDAFADPGVTDLSIRGRDVLNHFDVIVSRRRNQVLLLASNHEYLIKTP